MKNIFVIFGLIASGRQGVSFWLNALLLTTLMSLFFLTFGLIKGKYDDLQNPILDNLPHMIGDYGDCGASDFLTEILSDQTEVSCALIFKGLNAVKLYPGSLSLSPVTLVELNADTVRAFPNLSHNFTNSQVDMSASCLHIADLEQMNTLQPYALERIVNLPNSDCLPSGSTEAVFSVLAPTSLQGNYLSQGDILALTSYANVQELSEITGALLEPKASNVLNQTMTVVRANVAHGEKIVENTLTDGGYLFGSTNLLMNVARENGGVKNAERRVFVRFDDKNVSVEKVADFTAAINQALKAGGHNEMVDSVSGHPALKLFKDEWLPNLKAIGMVVASLVTVGLALMTISVIEGKRKLIAVLRISGFKDYQIGSVIFLIIIFLYIFTGILACALAWWGGSILVAALNNVSFSFPIDALIGQLKTGIPLGLVVAFIAFRLICKKDIASEFRHVRLNS